MRTDEVFLNFTSGDAISHLYGLNREDASCLESKDCLMPR